MTEQEFRSAILAESDLWIGTPYKNVGRIRGVGANCAQLVFGIYKNAGVLAPDAPEPRWYAPQLHVHSREERLIEYIKAYGGVEISEDEAKPADLIVYKTGQSHGHGAIIVDFPARMVHTLPMTGCTYGHCTSEGRVAQCARRYFTLWK